MTGKGVSSMNKVRKLTSIDCPCGLSWPVKHIDTMNAMITRARSINLFMTVLTLLFWHSWRRASSAVLCVRSLVFVCSVCSLKCWFLSLLCSKYESSHWIEPLVDFSHRMLVLFWGHCSVLHERYKHTLVWMSTVGKITVTAGSPLV